MVITWLPARQCCGDGLMVVDQGGDWAVEGRCKQGTKKKEVGIYGWRMENDDGLMP